MFEQGFVQKTQRQTGYCVVITIDIVNQKMQKNSSLEAVVNFQKLRDDNGNPLVFEENISKLADELEKQSATLSQQITLEQERRKANSKGGKDK